MLTLMVKLYSIFLPFIKEILLGNRRIKNQERNVNYFLIFVCLVMFFLLMIANVTNSKLISKVKEIESSYTTLKEENKTLGIANSELTDRVNQQDITLNEKEGVVDKLYEKVEELENIQCNVDQNTLSNKFRNMENGICELDSLNLKADMPPIPKLSRTLDDDIMTGEIMIKYITDLREYIRTKDEFIEKQKGNCK